MGMFSRVLLATSFAAVVGYSSLAIAQDTPKPGGVVRLAIERDIENFEPQRNFGTSTPLFQGQIYETLTGYDESGNLIGLLAESWEQPDPLTWTFKLRHGVVFHDGEPFDSADVVYSFERLLNPKTAATRAAMLSLIDKVEAPTPDTVSFKLKKPLETLPLIFSLPDVAILKKGWAESGHDYSQATNGTGPFKLGQFERNVSYSLDKNEAYWRPQVPLLDKVEIIPIRDEPTRVNALLSGDVDMASLVPWERTAEIEADPQLAMTKTFDSFMMLRLNPTRKPFDDVRVRQALNYAIDRKAISDLAWGGGAQPMTGGFIRPDSNWYTKPTTEWTYDPDKARKLLAEAGLKPSDIKFTLLSITFVHLPTSEVVVNQLRQFGMDVSLETIEAAVLLEKRGTGDYVAMMDGGSNPFADPEFYSLWFASDGGNFAKGVGYSNPKLDELLLASRRETDVEKRKGIIHKAEDMILVDAPMGFLVWRPQVEAYDKKVKGYKRIPGFGSDSPIYLKFDHTWISE